jgi:hypothetical protein
VVLGATPAAASTVGTFLRAFTARHVRQLDAVQEDLLQLAWEVGPRPQEATLRLWEQDAIPPAARVSSGVAAGCTGPRHSRLPARCAASNLASILGSELGGVPRNSLAGSAIDFERALTLTSKLSAAVKRMGSCGDWQG